MQIFPLTLAAVLVASAAFAADSGAKSISRQGTLGTVNGQSVNSTTTSTASPGAEATMGELLSQGYAIKAAVPNGGKFIVFMQKDQSAYACEFESLTGARCGSIN